MMMRLISSRSAMFGRTYFSARVAIFSSCAFSNLRQLRPGSELSGGVLVDRDHLLLKKFERITRSGETDLERYHFRVEEKEYDEPLEHKEPPIEEVPYSVYLIAM
jgi:hypothetical protein